MAAAEPYTCRWRDGDNLDDALAAIPPDQPDGEQSAVLDVDGGVVPARLLGALCRRFPLEVVVRLDQRAVADNGELFRSLGFSATAESSWRFSLSDYKPAPAWLNADNWANPERFGLDVGMDGEDENYVEDGEEDEDEDDNIEHRWPDGP